MDYINIVATPEIMFWVSIFSLAWLMVGVILGRMMRSGGGRSHHGHGRGGRNRGNGGGDDAPARDRDDSNGLIEIYVGNLSYDMSESDLQETFEEFGEVASSRIIKHRMSGKSKGFGFIEMPDRSEVDAAIRALDGKEVKGRKLVVNEAKSRSRDD